MDTSLIRFQQCIWIENTSVDSYCTLSVILLHVLQNPNSTSVFTSWLCLQGFVKYILNLLQIRNSACNLLSNTHFGKEFFSKMRSSLVLLRLTSGRQWVETLKSKGCYSVQLLESLSHGADVFCSIIPRCVVAGSRRRLCGNAQEQPRERHSRWPAQNAAGGQVGLVLLTPLRAPQEAAHWASSRSAAELSCASRARWNLLCLVPLS